MDPWSLRTEGLDRALTGSELGRAIYHLNQRRGFLSNRKVDKGDDDGAIATGAQAAQVMMDRLKARTLGEALVKARSENLIGSKRARATVERSKASYAFYPTRSLILAEFDALWVAQAEHSPSLATEAARDEIRSILSFQRPLKPQPVGRCTLEPEKPRAPWALPSCQRRRLLETLNHLTLRTAGGEPRALTREERNKLYEAALSLQKLTFEKCRKLLNEPDAIFSHESEKRKHIDGDATAAVLASKGAWGKTWRDLPLPQQDAVVEILIGQSPVTAKTPPMIATAFEEAVGRIADVFELPRVTAEALLLADEAETVQRWLAEQFGLEEPAAAAIVVARLPDGFAHLGRDATRRVLSELERDVVTYSDAVVRAGFHSHSDLSDGVVHEQGLPYYGEVLERSVAFGSGDPGDMDEARIGRLANPTVHVALNQLRKVVNALIARFGLPSQIVIELARDLPLSGEARQTLERDQAKRQKENEARDQQLRTLGLQPSYQNRLRMRLWEELGENCLDRRCVFTGENISLETLFSDAVEIEHILPRSMTFDDSPSNKTVAMRRANRVKAKRSPWEAFGESPEDFRWEDIAARAAALPPNKSWRFTQGAMDRFADEAAFQERLLTDTKHTSKLARAYVGALYGGGVEAARRVWVSPGNLTSDVRHALGLDSILRGHNTGSDEPQRKNRDDHRHHAIDAAVVAITDRSLLKKIADNAAKADAEESLRFLADLEPPWEGFRDDIQSKIGRIVISHKQDHGLGGRLHEDTAYGVVRDPQSGEERLAVRKAIDSLTRGEVAAIGDDRIRRELMAELESGADLKAVLHAYAAKTGVRRVRIHKKESGYVEIRHGSEGQFAKAVIPGENFCIDVVETPDGRWRGVGVTRFAANREAIKEPWRDQFPKARHVMRLHKGDLLALSSNNVRKIAQVVRLEPSNGRVRLAEHFEAGQLQNRHEDPQDLFRWDLASISGLKQRRARKVHVDPTGRVHDPEAGDDRSNGGGGV